MDDNNEMGKEQMQREELTESDVSVEKEQVKLTLQFPVSMEETQKEKKSRDEETFLRENTGKKWLRMEPFEKRKEDLWRQREVWHNSKEELWRNATPEAGKGAPDGDSQVRQTLEDDLWEYIYENHIESFSNDVSILLLQTHTVGHYDAKLPVQLKPLDDVLTSLLLLLREFYSNRGE
ncbi:hypothetical protein P7K49_031689 [Saguinus oedipus]|uniref:Uncharacterized protein n=1 Tax=Saguinus oedipus TaxID=9490 RepID=A0ABQ9U052_SAGOE|nr:hypothetical protein P7K49_031689 [Saguinus oedipus]